MFTNGWDLLTKIQNGYNERDNLAAASQNVINCIESGGDCQTEADIAAQIQLNQIQAVQQAGIMALFLPGTSTGGDIPGSLNDLVFSEARDLIEQRVKELQKRKKQCP